VHRARWLWNFSGLQSKINRTQTQSWQGTNMHPLQYIIQYICAVYSSSMHTYCLDSERSDEHNIDFTIICFFLSVITFSTLNVVRFKLWEWFLAVDWI